MICLFPFHTVHGVLKAKTLKWFAIPFSSGPHCVRPVYHAHPSWVAPQGTALFHWVRQGCGPSVIRLTSFLWVWFQCVYPLMPSCNTTILLGFLLPWAWGISSRLLQQSTAAAPYLGRRVSPYCHHSWPSTWDSSSRPSCACLATTPRVAPPGRWSWPRTWVAPPSCRPWPRARMAPRVTAPDLGHRVSPPGHRCPRTQGSSSRPFLRRRSLALEAAAPDFGRGVAPFVHA